MDSGWKVERAFLEIASAWVGFLDGLYVRIDGNVNLGVKDPRAGDAACICCGLEWV